MASFLALCFVAIDGAFTWKINCICDVGDFASGQLAPFAVNKRMAVESPAPPPLRSQLANTTVCVLLIASRKEAVCVSADILKVRWWTSVGNS